MGLASPTLKEICRKPRLADAPSSLSVLKGFHRKDPGRYIPIIFLLQSWGSLFGFCIEVPFCVIPRTLLYTLVGMLE